MKKLIIWDFDGVIADTEKLWIENSLYFLQRNLKIDWDFNQAYKHIGGISQKDVCRNLTNLGFDIKKEFLQEIDVKFRELLKQIKPTPYIKEIFRMKSFNQCIATGGIMEETLKKIKYANIDKYFDESRIFTAEMVKNGKPEPDLFLYAASKMGYTPQDAIVVEDSTVGVMAAQNAGMKVIAFVKYNTPEVKKMVEDLHPDYMVDDMREVKKILLDFYNT